ncbi:MAG: ABC transporter ATP-binding protein [Candidatus Poribacteria bacterium]|nr:MAG: ABC transporter ATP-binding protein [Candidatus Poribacteria bacterium]
MATVHIEGVTKRFGGTVALDGLSLEVQDGEFFCLLGPSGAGKTTLLRCIAGLEVPDAGRIMIGGVDVTGWTPAERGVAMVFESYALYPHLSVFENLAYPLRERRTPEETIRHRVLEVAEKLRITHTLDRPPQTLSGGEMQRVAIGRAIVREAQVYLFDEPLSHLDAQLREQMRSELKRLHRELGQTLIYATPDQLEALTMPDRVAVIRSGRVVECGPPMELYYRPQHAFTAQYLGDPPMNWLPARLKDDVAQTEWFHVRLPFRAPFFGEGFLGVRPEDLCLSDGDAAPPEAIRFQALVYAVEMSGDFNIVTLRLGDRFLKAIGEVHRRYPTDRPVGVTVLPERLFLMDPVSERVWSLRKPFDPSPTHQKGDQG